MVTAERDRLADEVGRYRARFGGLDNGEAAEDHAPELGGIRGRFVADFGEMSDMMQGVVFEEDVSWGCGKPVCRWSEGLALGREGLRMSVFCF